MLNKKAIIYEFGDVCERIEDRWGRDYYWEGNAKLDPLYCEIPHKRVFYVATKYLERIYYKHYQKRNITAYEFISFVIDNFNKEFRKELYGLEPADIKNYSGTILDKYMQIVEDTINNNEMIEIDEDRCKVDKDYYYRYWQMRNYVVGRYELRKEHPYLIY